MTTHGLADTGRAEIGPRVLSAWDAFLAAAAAADLDRVSGLSGWRGQEICVHLGLWGEHWAVHGLIASARAGGTGVAPTVEAENSAVLGTHRHAARAEVLAALRRHRDAVALYFANSDQTLDLAPAVSPLGRLPLLSLLLGQAYELAVHALDLVDCGAPPPPAGLLDSGLAGLAELIGGRAVEAGLTGGFALLARADRAADGQGSGGWGLAVGGEGWTVSPIGASRLGGTVIAGDAADLLRAASGRVDARALLAARRIGVQSLGGLLRFAPLADTPAAPGGPLLRLA